MGYPPPREGGAPGRGPKRAAAGRPRGRRRDGGPGWAVTLTLLLALLLAPRATPRGRPVGRAAAEGPAPPQQHGLRASNSSDATSNSSAAGPRGPRLSVWAQVPPNRSLRQCRTPRDGCYLNEDGNLIEEKVTPGKEHLMAHAIAEAGSNVTVLVDFLDNSDTGPGGGHIVPLVGATGVGKVIATAM